MIENKNPRVSIGLPVYNGEKYLETALDAILAQTFSDFELIISDNASTDRTQEICLSYLEKDARIRYYRNEKNIGLAPNFNRVFELARGEYFAFAAHDDLMGAEFIEKCVDVLDRDQTVILCHSQVVIMDDQGEPRARYDKSLLFPNEGSARPHERFRDLILVNHLCLDDYGVVRAKLLTMRPLYASYYGSDRNFLAELSLLGKFYHVPQELFFWRDEQAKYWRFDSWSNRLVSWKTWAENLDKTKPKKIPVPRWGNLKGYLVSVGRVSLDKKERMLCYVVLAEWTLRHLRGLGKDVLLAGLIFVNESIQLVRKLATGQA